MFWKHVFEKILVVFCVIYMTYVSSYQKTVFFGCKFYGALKRLCVRLAIAVLIITDTLAKGKELSREGTI